MKSGVRIAASLSASLILAGASEPLVKGAVAGAVAPLAPYYSVFPEVTLREHSGESYINIHREGDLRFGSSVEFMTREWGWQRAAVAGEDYVSVSGTAHFQAGETDQQIVIRLLDDTVAEPPKMFEFILTNATGRSSEWFNSAQLWIEDDDFNPLRVDPDFHTPIQYNGTSEQGDDLTFPMLPDGRNLEELAVHWETTRDGTAQPGVDFVATQGELFFTSGRSEASIAIELLDNHLLDGERDVVVALRTAAGPLPPVTFTIINDDLGFVSHGSSKGGALMLKVTGNRAEPCQIETSENLRDWRRPRSIPFAGDIYDLTGAGTHLFYRLVR